MLHFVAQELALARSSAEFRAEVAAIRLRVIANYSREYQGAPWWKKLWVNVKILAAIQRELGKLHPRHRLYQAGHRQP